MIDPLAAAWKRHVWRMDLAFVPGDEDAGPPPWARHEMWRMHVGPIMGLRLEDWREWENLALFENEDVLPIIGATMENLCSRSLNPHSVEIHDCRFLKREGYGFICQMEGEVFPPEDGSADEDGVAGEFRLLMEIPFVSVEIAVPVNATDPLAAGRALAEREIRLRDSARSKVTPFDPERAAGAFGHHYNKHTVRLETTWRGGR